MKLAHFTQSRRLLSIFALLVAGLSLHAAWSLLEHPDAAWLAGLINRQVLLERGLRLELQGPLQIRYRPQLEVRLGAFALHGDETPLLEARSLQLRLPWSALLSKQLIIEQLTLDHPRLWLVRDPQGRLNIARFLESAEPSGKPVSLQQLEVREGRIMYTDQLQDRRWQLDALQLYARATRATRRTSAHETAMAGRLQLAARLRWTPATGQNLAADRFAFAPVQLKFTSGYELQLGSEGHKLTLSQLDAVLHTGPGVGKDPEANPEPSPETAVEVNAGIQAASPLQLQLQARELQAAWPSQTMAISQLRGRWQQGGGEGLSAVHLSWRAEHGQWRQQQLSIPALSIVGGFKAAGQELRAGGAGAVHFAYPQRRLELKDIDARLELISPRFHEPLVMSLLGQARLVATAEEQGTSAQADIELGGQLAGSPYDGKLQLSGLLAAPHIAARLSLQQLDLDRLLAKAPAAGASSSSAADHPDSMRAGLPKATLQAELYIDQLKFNGLNIRQAQLGFTERDLQWLRPVAEKTSR